MRVSIQSEVAVDQHVVAIGDRSLFQLRTVKPNRASPTGSHQAHGNGVTGTVCGKGEIHTQAIPGSSIALGHAVYGNISACIVLVSNPQLRKGIRQRFKECGESVGLAHLPAAS